MAIVDTKIKVQCEGVANDGVLIVWFDDLDMLLGADTLEAADSDGKLRSLAVTSRSVRVCNVVEWRPIATRCKCGEAPTVGLLAAQNPSTLSAYAGGTSDTICSTTALCSSSVFTTTKVSSRQTYAGAAGGSGDRHIAATHRACGSRSWWIRAQNTPLGTLQSGANANIARSAAEELHRFNTAP